MDDVGESTEMVMERAAYQPVAALWKLRRS